MIRVHDELTFEELPTDAVFVPRATLQKWKDDLGPYWFSSSDGEDYNNDEIIDMDAALGVLLK